VAKFHVGLARRRRGGAFERKVSSSLKPKRATVGAVLLPQFAANGGWATEIDILNAGSASLAVRVDLFKPDGTALTATLNGQSGSSLTNITIPAGGVVTLSPRDSNGDSRF